MIVVYRERAFFGRYSCIDNIKKVAVKEKSFTQGGLTYFKKDRFNYFVIDTDFIIEVIED